MRVSTFHEIRFHGRGGQGMVSAAVLLALAAFEDHFERQAFPRFGSERRGAPVEAYVRISSTVIRAHNQMYTPDAILIQDAGLLRFVKNRLPETRERLPHATTTHRQTLNMSLSRLVEPLRLFHPTQPMGLG